MISLDLLTMISAGAVFPYVAEATVSWVRLHWNITVRRKCTKLVCAHDGN